MTETFSRLAESGKAYSHEWRDPEIPARLSPTSYLLDKHLSSHRADKVALIADDVPYTYRELFDLVSAVTAGLRELGVAAGSRLLMVGTDSAEYLALWLACVRSGVVPVVVSDQVKAAQLAYYLRDVEPTVLYVDDGQLAKLAEAEREVQVLPRTVVVRGDAPMPDGALASVALERMHRLTSCTTPPPEPVELHANDTAYMLYSGSTTGPAKGVIHLAHDFVLVPERQGAYWEYTEADVVHATSKKFFTHGLWPGVLIPLYWGSTAVTSGAAPTGETVVRIVEKHRPTKLITVPTTVKAILRQADESGTRPDLSSVGLVVTASEQVPTEIAVRFDELFGLELMDSIGSSEVTYEWVANRQRDYRRGTLGRPVFGYEIKLVDADGGEVTRAGVEGEAWVRSNTACLYYWRKFDATRQTFMGPWTRTGDMLRITEDGYFQFVGRRDDLFKVSGLWVSPLEVEGAIATSPAVHEVAVIGAPDENGLTRPVAFVVLRGGEEPSEELADDLRARVREVGGYKVPGNVRFVDALPRTPLMKINRRALRELDLDADDLQSGERRVGRSDPVSEAR